MKNIKTVLEKWQLDVQMVRKQVYAAETSRERERWHAVWLMTQGWTETQVSKALERDAHTIGEWLESLDEKGPMGLTFEQSGGPPPPSMRHNRRH
jgi:transposase